MSLHFQHLKFRLASTLSLRQLRFIIRIRNLNFGSNFYSLLCIFDHLYAPWCDSVIAVKWCQDGKIAFCWSLHCNLSATSRRSVANQSLKIFRQSVLEISWRLMGEWSATVWGLVRDWWATFRKPVQLVSDGKRSRLVFYASSKDQQRQLLIGDGSVTLLQTL